ncbi:MAG: ATP-binding protein [Desulfobacteraceae bacterium]
MLISVASGKGGTGKTTVATNLAYSLGKRAAILDCDVEEPNAHLFLKPVIREVDKVNVEIPKVNMELCTLCRKCADICRFRAIAVVGKSVLVFPELCHSCGGCFKVCEPGAIGEGFRELGEVERGASGDIGFVKGCLRVGEAMSPPLIKKVRTYQDSDRINVIDAPPGTSCPVIAAMKGTDFVLMVTEPTPFGLHDLILAVGAVKILGIPHGLVINRSDMGDDKVREYARAENIPVLMEIPFDRRIAECYSRGGLIAEMYPEWKESFQELFQKIQSQVLS